MGLPQWNPWIKWTEMDCTTQPIPNFAGDRLPIMGRDSLQWIQTEHSLHIQLSSLLQLVECMAAHTSWCSWRWKREVANWRSSVLVLWWMSGWKESLCHFASERRSRTNFHQFSTLKSPFSHYWIECHRPQVCKTVHEKLSTRTLRPHSACFDRALADKSGSGPLRPPRIGTPSAQCHDHWASEQALPVLHSSS